MIDEGAQLRHQVLVLIVSRSWRLYGLALMLSHLVALYLLLPEKIAARMSAADLPVRRSDARP